VAVESRASGLRRELTGHVTGLAKKMRKVEIIETAILCLSGVQLYNTGYNTHL